MKVEITVKSDELKKVLRKLPDTEFLLRIGDSFVVEGANSGRRIVVDAKVRFVDVPKQGATAPRVIERVFPDFEIVRWLKTGDVLKITFKRGRDGTWREFKIQGIREEVTVW